MLKKENHNNTTVKKNLSSESSKTLSLRKTDSILLNNKRKGKLTVI